MSNVEGDVTALSRRKQTSIVALGEWPIIATSLVTGKHDLYQTTPRKLRRNI